MTAPANPIRKSLPDASVLAADHARLGNVWKVGAIYGVAGSTVHWRLLKAGLISPRSPEFTDAQIERIKQYYAETDGADFSLHALADEFGKSVNNISRVARRFGLTTQHRPRNAAAIAKGCKPRWKNRPHPRPMLGKKQSEEAKAAIGAAARKHWATCKTFGIHQMSPENLAAASKRFSLMQANRPAERSFTRSNGGHREDLGGIFFRSSWEANYARYLDLLIKFKVVKSWQFEPEIFWFEGVRRGVVSYKPDFKVYYHGDERPEYIEIKGWEVAKDRTKWKRMKKYHPHIKLVVVGAKEYRSIQAKWASSIPAWEKRKQTSKTDISAAKETPL